MILKLLPFSHFVISGSSMEPTLKNRHHVFSTNWFPTLKVDDLVVAKVGKRLIIKRISQIKGDQVFLKGDNEKESTDSRNFGWVNKSQVYGKVFFVF